MGKSLPYTFRVEYLDQSGWHSQGWKGRASDKVLEGWRRTMNKSFGTGGVNEHLSLALGYVLHISYAKIIHQASGLKVAEARMPMFEVVE